MNPICRTLLAGGLLFLNACVNLYTHVDRTPDGKAELSFDGIRDYLSKSGSELHVIQMHGMGNHPEEEFCSERSENYTLQTKIVKALGLSPVGGTIYEGPINVDGTKVGSITTHAYAENPRSPTRALYFSCLTWGDASKAIKIKMLELQDGSFNELTENEHHRAPLNRWGKRFINRSFSDPVIYAGKFGELIRQAVWQGLHTIQVAQSCNQKKVRSLSPAIANRLKESPENMSIIVLNDSLGSRVIFDVLCSRQQEGCPATSHMDRVDEAFSRETRVSIREVFMLANQLPLLELALVPPPPAGMTLDDWLEDQPCRTPLAVPSGGQNNLGTTNQTTIVALTDQNDLLSYHLSDDFKKRCAPLGSGVDIVNVTLPNARLRILGLVSDPGRAHASGFKSNSRAIRYIVEGNHPPHP